MTDSRSREDRGFPRDPVPVSIEAVSERLRLRAAGSRSPDETSFLTQRLTRYASLAGAEQPLEAEPSPSSFDGAVLLAMPGWKTELRGNRWHAARCLSQSMKVLLVQPDQTFEEADPRLEAEERLDGVTLLHTICHGAFGEEVDVEAMVQSADIALALAQLDVRRPVYWLYSPFMAWVFTRHRQGPGVFHLAEDWFTFPGFEPLREAVVEAIWDADVVVGVSRGVVESARRHSGCEAIVTESNGCDFTVYSRRGDGVDWESLFEGWTPGRVAIYAGNVDFRMDFELVEKLLRAETALGLVVVGRDDAVDPADRSEWERIKAFRRCVFLPPVSAEGLADLYHSADLGILPFRPLPLVVESSFSGKLLEMAASGLPVVLTRMKSVEGLCQGLRVCLSHDEFLREASETDRERTTEAVGSELVSIAERNDYQAKFEGILSRLARPSHEVS